MMAFEPGIYVRIETCLKAPPPLPLVSGFSSDRKYRVLGIYSPSETSEAYMILVNDADQIWFISNRHLRFVCLDPGCPFSSTELKAHSEAEAGTGTATPPGPKADS